VNAGLAPSRDDRDVDLRIARQARHFDRRAGRRVLLEIRRIDRVHGRELVQVFHVNGARQHVVIAQALRRQPGADVVEHAARLFLDGGALEPEK
jgi:hypothetical protein